MSDELKVGDWVRVENAELTLQIREVIRSGAYAGQYEFDDMIFSPDECRRATPAEIAAATGQPQEEGTEIEVGDTVELTDAHIRMSVTQVLGGQVWGREDNGVHWFSFRDKCRLVSKGKGQGECGNASQPCEADRLSGASPASPCPPFTDLCRVCNGTGKIPDWYDKPIACPRCQYGKPKPEPEVTKPYHRLMPNGVIALHDNDGYGMDVHTEADNQAIRAEAKAGLERNAAAKALAKAQAEAKRLGLLPPPKEK